MDEGVGVDGRKLRYRHRRAELLAQVTEYVTVNGVGGLSMRPLAKDLGISHATLIHHFGSKEQLLTEVVAVLRDQSFCWNDDSTAGVELLHRYWRERTSPEALPAFRVMFEIYGQALLHQDRYREFLEHVVADWLGNLTDLAVAQGCAPVQADRYATIVLAQIRGLTLDLLTTGDRERVDAAFGVFVESMQALFVAWTTPPTIA
ncbi:TetR/AcrR family transcriptional regulator [Rhodococcus sp. 27YEA15]|uniref:TetR/AcrR family transcriptional regulator n=1 Tax=Rhodococcus sp. 27YEA15 TaxID=3156259 RepID=UPI003C7E930B